MLFEESQTLTPKVTKGSLCNPSNAFSHILLIVFDMCCMQMSRSGIRFY